MHFVATDVGFGVHATLGFNASAVSMRNEPLPTRVKPVEVGEATFAAFMMWASGGWVTWQREISESSFARSRAWERREHSRRKGVLHRDPTAP